ncbi:AMP-dependent synthetase and ligase [Mycobacterium lentiflavum]|uniref:AMP-dependent synthetase and ligase n=1 Tax=Mycobacterium lentiflavum TaxID=141349 RepID=A0A0E4CR32_MYCLN|nr:AMP-binding protein [Mycobacterium lentiflavum]CQD23862.1 AMP-dependent synthetase and ligase [Mycobacterium lentiflavum]
MIDRHIPWMQPSSAPGRFREMGIWGDQTIADVIDAHAQRHPGKTAVIDSRESLTYGELRDLSLRLARILLDHGVDPGDPVAVHLPGCVLLPALHLACNRIGALFLPVSTGWRGAELQSLLGTVRAPMLIVLNGNGGFDYVGLAETLRGGLPDLKHVLTARSGSLESLAAAAAPLTAGELDQHRPSADAPAHVMSSSGTTGIPKASVWSSNDLIALLVHHMGPRLHIGPDDIAAAIAPASTGSTGYAFPVLAPLLVGATAALLETWKPQAALDLIIGEQCTYATAVPTQMIMMLELPLEQHDLSHFTRFNNAGAPLPPSAARDLESRMGCRVQTLYGATDGGVPTITSIDDPDELRHTTVGSVCPGVEVVLLGADGTAVPPGDPGEVCWRGPNKSYGYLNEPDYDRQAWDDEGFFHSGDVGEFDDRGYLRIVGRIKDMILRGGTNIFPREVEELLHEHPVVAAVAIVGIPDARLGERACAAVVPALGAHPRLDDLCSFLLDRHLAKTKLPERLIVLDELPTNAGGKVDKALIRDIAIKDLAGRARDEDGISARHRSSAAGTPVDTARSTTQRTDEEKA